MKLIITMSPADLDTNSASWWFGNENYFCFLFIGSHSLLQSHTEFNRLLQRNFLTCYEVSLHVYKVCFDEKQDVSNMCEEKRY